MPFSRLKDTALQCPQCQPKLRDLAQCHDQVERILSTDIFYNARPSHSGQLQIAEDARFAARYIHPGSLKGTAKPSALAASNHITYDSDASPAFAQTSVMSNGKTGHQLLSC